jgi:hypothetical protein
MNAVQRRSAAPLPRSLDVGAGGPSTIAGLALWGARSALRCHRPALTLPRRPSSTRRSAIREPAMAAQSHPRGLGVRQRNAAARSIGWGTRLPRVRPPAVLRVRIWSPGWRTAAAKKYRQERHQQENHEEKQSSQIYSAELGLTWHETQASARSTPRPAVG